MKRILIIGFLVNTINLHAQINLNNTTWIEGETSVFHETQLEFNQNLFTSTTVGFGERLYMFSNEDEFICDSSGARLTIPGEKKPLRLDFYGYYKIDGELKLLCRTSGDKGLKDLWLVSGSGDKNFFGTEPPKKLVSAKDLKSIQTTMGFDLNHNNIIAFTSSKLTEKGKYSGKITTISLYDLNKEKIINETEIETDPGLVSRYINPDHTFLESNVLAFMFRGNVQILTTDGAIKKKIDLSEILQLQDKFHSQMLAFKKTTKGEYVGLIADIGSTGLLNKYVHRVVFDKDFNLIPDLTITWDIQSDPHTMKYPKIKPFINSNGDVFITSNGFEVYATDIMGITYNGDKWIKNLPYNHGKGERYHAHIATGLSFQYQLHNDELYISYLDNKNNLLKYDPNDYLRPEKGFNTTLFNEIPEEQVISLLRVKANGNINVEEQYKFANTDVMLTLMKINKSGIYLGGAQKLDGAFQYKGFYHFLGHK